MFMPEMGSTCYYTFTTRFAGFNGIYHLVHSGTYQDAVSQGMDLYKTLYEPTGLTKEDLETDWVTYRTQPVFKLQHADTLIEIYAPLAVIDQTPDPMVVKCHDLGLTVHLGYYKDSAKIRWIKTQIDDMVTSVVGTTNTTSFITRGQRYLRQSDYDTMESTRSTHITQINPLTKQLQDQKKMIDTLQTKINAYEALLVTLHTGG